MFGYITPAKPLMRICDYDLYKSIYCSICFELKNNFGFMTKAFLNYDFVFLSILARSIHNVCPKLSKKKCNTNCLKSCQVSDSVETDRYCAAALITSAYFKLLDNISDELFLKKIVSAVSLPFAKRGYKKAKRLYPALTEAIEQCVIKQRAVENSTVNGIDYAADSTSAALSGIFSGLAASEDEQRVLSRLGYLIGRFVYISDAVDDIDDDIKYNRYNPLVNQFAGDTEWKPAAVAFAKEELNATASEIANSYNLLNITLYSEILNNIIFLGLKNTIAMVGKKKGKMNEQSV